MEASEALLGVLSKLALLSLGRGLVEFAVTMCCGKKKFKSLLNNPRLVCLHLFEILKGTHHAEHYVEIGAQVEEQGILLYSFCCVLSILNLKFLLPNWGGVCVDKT